jgi:hypothetical protein
VDVSCREINARAGKADRAGRAGRAGRAVQPSEGRPKRFCAQANPIDCWREETLDLWVLDNHGKPREEG